jgi:hypothetical protein
MNKYTNDRSYGRMKPKSIVFENKPDVVHDLHEQPEQQEFKQVSNRGGYLAGERLLKKLNSVPKKPLDLKILERSLAEVLSTF